MSQGKQTATPKNKQKGEYRESAYQEHRGPGAEAHNRRQELVGTHKCKLPNC